MHGPLKTDHRHLTYAWFDSMSKMIRSQNDHVLVWLD